MEPIRALVLGDNQNEEAISLAISYADEICKLKQGTIQNAVSYCASPCFSGFRILFFFVCTKACTKKLKCLPTIN